MSSKDINPFDWYRNFFAGDPNRRSKRSRFFDDYFDGFDEMQAEMERMFRQFSDLQSNAPKELVREYQSPDGTKMREVGPIVYGYSMTIGPDGKPHISHFGNVKNLRGINTGNKVSGNGNDSSNSSSSRGIGVNEHGFSFGFGPSISAEREPLADVNTSENEIKVIVEMPGIRKEEIKINATETMLEVKSTNSQRKYFKIIDLPPEADLDTAKSTYNNGIIEIVFKKKENVKPIGKEVKVE